MPSTTSRGVPRRWSLSIAGLLVGIAVVAVLINVFRPITEAEAGRIAGQRFEAVPGGAAWVGKYGTRARFAEPFWDVNIIKPDTGETVAQVELTWRGELEIVIVVLPGEEGLLPVDSMTAPLPPPDQWRVDPNGPRSTMAGPKPGPTP